MASKNVSSERPFLVKFTDTVDGITDEFGFICKAESFRDAGETFWSKVRGEDIKIISVQDGSIEAFWNPATWRFVTASGREAI